MTPASNGEAVGRLERYIVDHAGASLSHGICPECAKRYVGTEPAGQ